MLGSGNPNPDPENAGPAVAVVVDDQAYIVDAGAGVVRRASAMSPRYGGQFAALAARNLTRLFLTHLHSDHTVGLADLILTPWVMGRAQPLRIVGPEGTADMVHHIHEAYEADIHYRLYGEEPANDIGWRVDAQEVDEGVVYEDSLVRVEAFRVPHGSWPTAFGYRFTTPDRVVVISGDSRPSENLERYARDADVLVHEVYYTKGLEEGRRHAWRSYHHAHHTSTHELGAIAARVRPKLLVLYHVLYWGAAEQDLLDEISTVYDGNVVVGKDKGIY
ncbi:MAG: MBL fold metallo-hydrolase [Ignavibacteria bacterium]|nr:MAG: MBL fold metallo-hydrolase [Ignavibacteria bacterium]